MSTVEFRQLVRAMDVHSETATPADARKLPLTWSVHPARDRLGAALAALAVMAALSWLVSEVMASPGWGLVAFAGMAAALRRFFLPSRYFIDDDGVTACGILTTQRYRWPEIRRFVVDDRGGYLSTRSAGSVLDVFGGMHLLFGEQREAAVAVIRDRMQPEGRT